MTASALHDARLRRAGLATLAVLLLSAALGLLVNALRPDGVPLFADWGEVRSERAARSTVALVEPGQALRLRQEGAVFLDVRDPEQFREGHVPGAVSRPLVLQGNEPRFSAALPGNLAAGALLVVYCDSGCNKALLAVPLLKARGLEPKVLAAGIEGWVAAGGALEFGP